MSALEKLVGAGAVVMALCCALLPLAGAAIGGGLITGAGTIGLVANAKRQCRGRAGPPMASSGRPAVY